MSRRCVGANIADLEQLGFRTVALAQTWRRRARDCAIGLRAQVGPA